MKKMSSFLMAISLVLLSAACSTEAADPTNLPDTKNAQTEQQGQNDDEAGTPVTPINLDDSAPENQGKIVKIILTGLKGSDGSICYSLFKSATGFPNNPQSPEDAKCVPALDTKEIELTMPPETTRLAISIFHDANSNGILDTGFFGIPKEGFGFSNNPPVSTSAPTFDQTSFPLAEEGITETNITLNYLF